MKNAALVPSRTKLYAVYCAPFTGVTIATTVAAYIYSTFPNVEREEIAADGSYSSRPKKLLLAYMRRTSQPGNRMCGRSGQ